MISCQPPLTATSWPVLLLYAHENCVLLVCATMYLLNKCLRLLPQ